MQERELGSLKVNLPEVLGLSRYRAVGRTLIVLSQAPNPYCDRVLDRLHATTLARPPDPEELSHFNTLIRVTQNSPQRGEDLRVQSVYTTTGDQHLIALGTLFPEFQPGLNHFQTMTGLLYPQTVVWNGVINEDEPGGDEMETNRYLLEFWLNALESKRVWQLTHLLSPRKQAKALESLLFPEDRTHRFGVIGLGDIGTFVASMIRQTDVAESGITDIFIGGSRSPEKVRAQALELRHINLEGIRQPNIHEVLPGEEDTFFQECDMILILIAGDIPPATITDIDVRSEQFGKNIAIITEFLQRAGQREYDGQILIASDPIEQLTMATYLKMKELGWDVASHQFAGFGGMINRSRAKAVADEMGLNSFSQEGRVFGPHGKMVVAIPTHDSKVFNHRQAEVLSLRTGYGNYRIREQGAKPYIGPAVLITQGILDMLSQEDRRSGIVYASPFIPADNSNTSGTFFGTRVEYHPFPGAWTPRVEQPSLPQVIEIIRRAHEWTSVTSQRPDALQENLFTSGEEEHPAFHPFMLETWMAKLERRKKPKI